MKEDGLYLLKKLKEKTKTVRDKRSKGSEIKENPEEAKRSNLINLDAKDYFNKQANEERLILFAEAGEGSCPIYLPFSVTGKSYRPKARSGEELRKNIDKFGKFLFDEIEANGFYPIIKEIKNKTDVKKLSVLDKGMFYKKGFYLAVSWLD